MTETRYIMLDRCADPVEQYHQDDESDICEAETIPLLLDIVADRVCDLTTSDFTEMLSNKNSVYYGWRIVRQEITTHELTDEEKTQLADIKDD